MSAQPPIRPQTSPIAAQMAARMQQPGATPPGAPPPQAGQAQPQAQPPAPVVRAMPPAAPLIELSAAEKMELQNAKDQHELKMQRMKKQLLSLLINKRDRVIKQKRDVERRWCDDMRQYDGDGRMTGTKEFPSQTSDDRSRPPRAHLTRARCDLWESRAVDLLCPTSEPTWDLAPLYEAHIEGMDDATAKQARADSEASCEAMKRVIKDQLAACNATRSLRRMCRDMCRIGFGLVIGPVNGIRVERKYTPPTPGADGSTNASPISVTTVETVTPEIQEGDPWCFFPDMVSDLENAEFAFYANYWSETQVATFREAPGVDQDEVDQLLDEKPEIGELMRNLRERETSTGIKEDISGRYVVWRYTGIVDNKYLDALGIPKPKKGIVSADLYFSNSRLLRARVSRLSVVQDYRIPYFGLSPWPLDDTPFGASVPYLCRDSQRTADTALLIALSNASVSAGVQLFLRKNKFEPADGKYAVRGPKTWFVTDDSTPIEQLMKAVQIPSNSAEALEIMSVAKQLMDEELNTAQWASPDTSENVQTASGTAMLMNARTILQRRVCAAADDDVFLPLLSRFVLWNLLFNPRTDIKGNYDVRPLCQSVRLVKDVQLQQKLYIATQLATQPQFQPMFNVYEMGRDIIRELDVNVDNWIKPKEQWEKDSAAAAQQPAAQMAQATAAANLQLTHQKIATEQAKQAKMYNDTQAAGQAATDASGAAASAAVTPDAALKHNEFMLEKQVQVHQTETSAQLARDTNQTKVTVAAMNAQAKREATGAKLHADLTKTAAMSGQGPKGRKAAGKPERLPVGKFTPPPIPKYRGGKR